MSEVPTIAMPEGYELRVARTRKGSMSDWTPADVMYSASEVMKDHPPEGAFMVCWYARNENGDLKLKFQAFQQHELQLKALSAEMCAWLVAP